MEPTRFNNAQVGILPRTGIMALSMNVAPPGGFTMLTTAYFNYPVISSYYYPDLVRDLEISSNPQTVYPLSLGYSALRKGIFCCDRITNPSNAAISILNDTDLRDISINSQYAYGYLNDPLTGPPTVLFAESENAIVTSGQDDLNSYNHLLICPLTNNLQTGSNLYYPVDFGDPADIFYALQNNGTHFLLAGEDSIGPYVRKCPNTADLLNPDNWVRFAQPVDSFFNCLYPVPNTSIWLAGGTNAGGYGGIWKSLDGGQTWIELTPPTQISDEVICALGSLNEHFVALTPYGTYLVSDDIEDWGDVLTISGASGVNDPLFYDNKALASGNEFFVYLDQTDIFYSTDNGATWTASGAAITGGDRVSFNPAIGKFYIGTFDGISTATFYSTADPSDAIDTLTLVFEVYSPSTSLVADGLIGYGAGMWIGY
jgi:hypothetical protein